MTSGCGSEGVGQKRGATDDVRVSDFPQTDVLSVKLAMKLAWLRSQRWLVNANTPLTHLSEDKGGATCAIH
jgi:hypothetical protein